MGWRISKILFNPKDLRRKFKKWKYDHSIDGNSLKCIFVKLGAAADL